MFATGLSARVRGAARTIVRGFSSNTCADRTFPGFFFSDFGLAGVVVGFFAGLAVFAGALAFLGFGCLGCSFLA